MRFVLKIWLKTQTDLLKLNYLILGNKQMLTIFIIVLRLKFFETSLFIYFWEIRKVFFSEFNY